MRGDSQSINQSSNLWINLHISSLPLLCNSQIPTNDAGSSSNRSRDFHRQWSAAFIRRGGLQHLVDILRSRKLHPQQHAATADLEKDRDGGKDGDRGEGTGKRIGAGKREWNQDCLAYLLNLLFHFASFRLPLAPAVTSPPTSSNSAKGTWDYVYWDKHYYCWLK